MDFLYPWLGNVHEIESLGREGASLIAIFASVACGAVIGTERERRDKPAGLRTVVLIAVGTTIFTLISLLLAHTKAMADPARLASQILPGIGFLGAGAIIQARGTVRGLTTGATIWAVAAVGVTVGAGYVAAGFAFTSIIFLALTLLNRLGWLVGGHCVHRDVRAVFEPRGGLTLPRIQAILDDYRVPDGSVDRAPCDDGRASLRFPVCVSHREHRSILAELTDVRGLCELEVAEG